MDRAAAAAISVEPAAAAPKSGHAQPKIKGSLITWRAIAGRNVLGMMYPKPKIP